MFFQILSKRKWLVGAVLVVLFGVVGGGLYWFLNKDNFSPPEESGLSEETVSPEEAAVWQKLKDDCSSRGGNWQMSFLDNGICNFQTSDADKKCSDNSECQGECLGFPDRKIGSCSDWEITPGCHYYLSNGEAQRICVD